MRVFAILLMSSLTIAVPAPAQVVDLGSEISGYTRFLVYPHLQKALEATERGDQGRALAEFEQARRLAPGNAAIVLQLAAAHRQFGHPERAEAVLRAQAALTPTDARITTALAQVRASMERSAVATRVAPPLLMPSPAVVPREALPPPMPPPAVSRTATARRPAPRRAPTPAARAIPPPPPSAEPAEAAVEPPSLDRVTFELVTAGETRRAALVLLEAYPFAGSAASERDMLLQRLVTLISKESDEWTDEQLRALESPLTTPLLRSRQAVLFASRDECDTVLSILGDLSPEYGHDDWMRLGDCAINSDPALARTAYTNADRLQPGGRASVALAYDAYATGDMSLALAAWRRVGVDQFSGNDLLGATTTALAAADDDQAAVWLDEYLERGEALNRRYWSLVADRQMRRDPAAAVIALRHAIADQPAAEDYVRLAQLEGDPSTQADLLERAVELDPASASIQAALGYAYWNAGRAADSRGAFELAWKDSPTNVILTEQLVYVYERTKQNDLARAYARRLLDASPASNATAANAESAVDKRFAFQRLHESMGRRVTVTADAVSGTSVGSGTNASLPGRGYRSFTQFEVDVRTGPRGRPDAALSAYARVLADGGVDGRALPSQDPMLGAGLRWKPWRSRIVYLAVENQIGLDDPSRRDVMLRVSGSFLGGGQFSDDWHPSGTGWFAKNLYLDGAHYLKTGNSAFTADLRTSYHRKMAANQTIEPYGHLQFSGFTNDGFTRDVRAGVGLRWNIWQGATAYDAAPHRISVGVEFQQAFDTYLADRNGVFVTVGVRW